MRGSRDARGSEGNQSAAGGAAEAGEEPAGEPGRDPQVRAQGFASIPPEWLGTYFRWWGVYTQGDGAGAVGGSNGEGKSMPYFMVRIRIPNGILLLAAACAPSPSLRGITRAASPTSRCGRTSSCTGSRSRRCRSCWSGLWRVGLTTMGACGDVTRNITGCPLAGVDADEICDASPLVREADTSSWCGNAEFYNLPRKFKISITGCRVWCSYPEINDIGLTAVRARPRTASPRSVSRCASAAGCPPIPISACG